MQQLKKVTKRLNNELSKKDKQLEKIKNDLVKTEKEFNKCKLELMELKYNQTLEKCNVIMARYDQLEEKIQDISKTKELTSKADAEDDVVIIDIETNPDKDKQQTSSQNEDDVIIIEDQVKIKIEADPTDSLYRVRRPSDRLISASEPKSRNSTPIFSNNENSRKRQNSESHIDSAEQNKRRSHRIVSHNYEYRSSTLQQMNKRDEEFCGLKCEKCAERFTHKQSLDKHVALKHSTDYKCNLCYKFFDFQFLLKAHMKNIHVAKK